MSIIDVNRETARRMNEVGSNIGNLLIGNKNSRRQVTLDEALQEIQRLQMQLMLKQQNERRNIKK